MDFYINKKFDKVSSDTILEIGNVSDVRHIVFSVHADANTTATFRVMGSAQEGAVDFTAAQSADNDWSYVAFRELASADLKVGATGATVSASTIHKIYEVESNVLTHCALEFSSVSGDGITTNVIAKA